MKKEQDLGFFGKVFVGILLVLLILSALVFVFGIIFFGFAGYFDVFGVEYESWNSLGLFLVFFLIFGLITDIVAQVFIVLTASYFADRKKQVALKIIVETAFAWMALFVVDEIMVTISVPTETELLLAILLTVGDFIFDGKRKNKKKK